MRAQASEAGLKSLAMALICAVTLLDSSAVRAAVAVLTDATGDVQVKVGTRPAVIGRIGLLVDTGATVTTGDHSTAVIRFEDGQVAALTERSQFRIVGYTFDVQHHERSSTFVSLIEGGLRFVTGVIGRRNPAGVRIQAGTVTAGVRGTDVSFAVLGGDTVTTVAEGAIALSLPTGQTFVVLPAQGVTARRDGTFQRASAQEIRQQLQQTPQGQRMAAQLNTLQALTPKVQEAIQAPPPSQRKPEAVPAEPVKPKPEAPKPPPVSVPAVPAAPVDLTAGLPPPAEPTLPAPTTTTTPTSGTAGTGGGGGTPASPN